MNPADTLLMTTVICALSGSTGIQIMCPGRNQALIGFASGAVAGLALWGAFRFVGMIS